jgi:hypothetical protein
MSNAKGWKATGMDVPQEILDCRWLKDVTTNDVPDFDILGSCRPLDREGMGKVCYKVRVLSNTRFRILNPAMEGIVTYSQLENALMLAHALHILGSKALIPDHLFTVGTSDKAGPEIYNNPLLRFYTYDNSKLYYTITPWGHTTRESHAHQLTVNPDNIIDRDDPETAKYTVAGDNRTLQFDFFPDLQDYLYKLETGFLAAPNVDTGYKERYNKSKQEYELLVFERLSRMESSPEETMLEGEALLDESKKKTSGGSLWTTTFDPYHTSTTY